MAIKASGGNPPTQSLSFSEIENEFGQNVKRSLGDYRMNNLNIGALTEVSLSRDGCGINANSDIPVDDQEIKFSDFFSARQNIIIDLHSVNENRVNAKNDKFNQSNPIGNFAIIGGSTGKNGPKPSNTNGKKVIIHVTKLIGSASGNVNNVALRTGPWNTGTEVLVEIDGGIVAGAGGNGGNGVENGTGQPGGDGTSALGIDYDDTDIQTTEGGKIICGFGGGGAGGGGKTKFEGDWLGRGKGPTVVSGGGGGGGGQGIPGGAAGTSPEGAAHNGTAGDHEEAGNGGEGAEVTSTGRGGSATTHGGTGGEGGHVGDTSADAGSGSFRTGGPHENPADHGGGGGGANGAAIRRGAFPDGTLFSFNLIGTPDITGDTNATGVS